MSTPLSTPPLDPPAEPSAAPRRLGRRPGCASRCCTSSSLGGLLFAVDHVLVGRADDPRTIVVGAEVDSEAIETFKAARGRAPNEEELEALRRVWLDNEVLYREGLALQVDKGDTAIRERVIFKALSVVDSNVKLPPPDDKVLRAVVREPPRQVRRAGPLRLRGGGALRRQLRSRRARSSWRR